MIMVGYLIEQGLCAPLAALTVLYVMFGVPTLLGVAVVALLERHELRKHRNRPRPSGATRQPLGSQRKNNRG